MTTPLEFPFKVPAPRRRLLAPLRAEIGRHEVKARAELARLGAFNEGQGSILEDTISEAIDPRSTELAAAVPASAAARDCRLCAVRAARRDKREGYDTWRARDLDRLIATLGTLAATLSALDESRRALLRAESAEVAELTQRKATA